MKISTEINSISQIVGDEKAVELIGKAGFDAWDFSLFSMLGYDWKNKKYICGGNAELSDGNHLAYARKLKQIGLDNGIVCNQSHAPFPTSPKMIKYLFRSIECTAEAGGSICVIHPDNNWSAKENARFYNEILPFAKEHNVKIATENMWNWDNDKNVASFAACSTAESFVEHLNEVNDESFVACLDIGHAEMMGDETSSVSMIKALGKKLQALHIHDNDKHYDSHQIPFSMDIDFVPIVKALKEINYSGYFTLEAVSYLSKYDKNNVFEGIMDLKNSVKKLVEMFE